jgi:spore germination protein YaaH
MNVRRRILASLLVGAALAIGAAAGPASSASATTLPSTTEAWIYPSSAGQPACDTPAELSALSTSPISVLKPEYLTVGNRGGVSVETAASLPCNGFSPANLAAVRQAAHSVSVTVSAGGAATKAILATASRMQAGVSTITSFVSSYGLNGVDIDFEPNKWSSTMWGSFKTFLSDLVGNLGPAGRSVEVDLFPFTTTPFDATRYGDIAALGAHVVVMAYDHEFDLPCAPISPYSWLTQVVAYAKSQVPIDDLTIGIPAYGYKTTTCTRVAHVTSNVAYVTMDHEPGFPTTPAAVNALRDPNSGEIRWSSGGVFYDYVDSTALNDKLAVVEYMGISDVSVWSLGGEPWFNGNPS